MLSFYSVKLNSFEMNVFNNFSTKLSNQEFRDYYPQSFTYLNLNELAAMAKDNSSAKEELIKRILPRVTSIVKKYYRNYKLNNYHELYRHTMEELEGIINSYNSSKGVFINFLSRSINRVIYFKVIKLLKENNRKTYWLGYKIKEYDKPKILEIEGENPSFKKIAFKIDLLQYFSKLQKKDRKIILLFLKGYTISEIASCIDCSIATVSIKIRKIIEEGKKKIGVSLI